MNDGKVCGKYIYMQRIVVLVVLEVICCTAIPPEMASRLSLGMALVSIDHWMRSICRKNPKVTDTKQWIDIYH